MTAFLIDCQVCGGVCVSSYGPACPVCAPPAPRGPASRFDALGTALVLSAFGLFGLLVLVQVVRWAA